MLYQKHRPRVLEEVKGQDVTVKEIKNYFINDKFPNVVLFSGSSGSGKTTLGHIVGKILNCESKINSYTPCNQCSSCRDINTESFAYSARSLDASLLNIDDMRQIDDLISISPMGVENILIFIEEFQELQAKQQKVILKTLEKFKKNVYFIIFTMDESKIDFAIKGGRTTHWKLKSLSPEIVAETLAEICEKENVVIDTDEKANVLFTIADYSNGSLRNAVTELDKVIMNGSWNLKEIEQSLNVKTSDSLNELCIKLIDKNPSIFKEEITKEVIESIRRNISAFLQSLLGVELEAWQKRNLKGLFGYKKATKENLLEILEVLDMTFKYPYLNREIINTILFRLFVKPIQSEKIILKEIVPRDSNLPVSDNVVSVNPIKRRREE